MKIEIKGMDAFFKKLLKLPDASIKIFSDEAVTQILPRVTRNTPVGVYRRRRKKGKKVKKKKATKAKKIGGTLRKGWSVTNVRRTERSIEIFNPAQNEKGAYYGWYVELGHRTRGGKGWVEGRKMLTRAVNAAMPFIRANFNAKIKGNL